MPSVTHSGTSNEDDTMREMMRQLREEWDIQRDSFKRELLTELRCGVANGNQNMVVGNHGDNQRQNTQFTKVTQLEFPKFGGNGVREWMFKSEQFFKVHNVPDENKVNLISLHLFDEALMWHKNVMRILENNVTWVIYKDAILQRFANVQTMQFCKDETHCNAQMMFEEMPIKNVPRQERGVQEFEFKGASRVEDGCFVGLDNLVEKVDKNIEISSLDHTSFGFVKNCDGDRIELGDKERSISSSRTENDGMEIEKFGTVAAKLNEFENVKEVAVIDKETKEYDIRKVFDKMGDVIECKFFSAHASYSETTVLNVDVKMDQEPEQKGNSDKGTRNLSHLAARYLLMHFKGDKKNGNSLGYWTFDMWKWPKRKKGCYTNYKFKGRWWIFESGNGLTENIFNNGNSFEFLYEESGKQGVGKNGPGLNGTFVDYVEDELTHMEFRINTFIDIVTRIEAELYTQVESLWVNDFQDKLTDNGRGTLIESQILLAERRCFGWPHLWGRTCEYASATYGLEHLNQYVRSYADKWCWNRDS